MTDTQGAIPFHEDERFWEAIEPFLFDEARWDAAGSEIDGVLNLAKPAPGAAILDLCCGVGRHSVELARRGFKVTAVDRTERYLAKARAKAKDANLHIEFLKGDSREFVRSESFDGAISLFTSMSYFEDQIEEKRLVENVCQSLRPGGFFVIDIMGREIIQRILKGKDWNELGGAFLLEKIQPSEDWTRMDNDWIYLKGSVRIDFKLRLHLYSAESLSSILESCGFQKPAVFGGLSGVPYDSNARRLVLVARK